MTSPMVHLLVLIHGMWGHPGHLTELRRIAEETHSTPTDGTQVEVLTPETNREDSTYDGIDWGGERVAKEIIDKVAELEAAGRSVTKISVTGYSLGGLIARYVLGILLQRGFFDKVTPVNFNTIATPHIGLLRYPSWLSSVFSNLGPKLLSRTGEQFYCVDKWSTDGRPLIVVMADPDKIFYQALSKFQHIRIYANAVKDSTVPYVTAAIETEDPFVEHETNGIRINLNPDYKYVVESFSFPEDAAPPPKSAILSREWFRELKHKKSSRKVDPMKVALYTLLPLLLPAIASLVIVRFSLASCSSKGRIKVLEQDSSSDPEKSSLYHILANLEQEIEEAVVDTVIPVVQEEPTPTVPRNSPIIRQKDHPILTSDQHKIAGWLNTLPLKKEVAFFPDSLNAHAMIISRDVNRFPSFKAGQHVMKHWADSLIL